VSRGDDVEVIGRAIVLVVLSMSQEFLVVHDPELCSLDGVVGVKGVRDPMFAVVVSTPSYLDFISYAAGFPRHDWPRPEEAELLCCVLGLEQCSPEH
jgi:hypothetical protein